MIIYQEAAVDISALNAQAIFSLKDWLKLISDCILVNRKNTLDLLAQKHSESRPFMESDPRSGSVAGLGLNARGAQTGSGSGTRVEGDDAGRLWVGSRSLRRSRDDAAVRCMSPFDDLLCTSDGDGDINMDMDIDGGRSGSGSGKWDGEDRDRDGEREGGGGGGGQSTDDYLSSSSDSESHSGAEEILKCHTGDSAQHTQRTTNSRARVARSFKRRARERKRREMYIAHHSAIAETQLTRFTEPLLSLAHTLILRDMRLVPTATR